MSPTSDLPRFDASLRAMLDAISDGIAVADRAGKMLYVNEAAARLMGSQIDFAGPERWTEQAGLFREDGTTPYPMEELPLFRALQGETVEDAVLHMRPPGRKEHVLISVTARPFVDLKGNVLGGIAQFHDITAQRSDQAARREAEEHFRELAMHIQEVFWIVSIEDRQLQYVSPAFEQISGYTVERVMNDPLWLVELIHPEDRERVVGFRTGQANEGELVYRILRKDGAIRWISSWMVAIRDSAGRAARYLGTATDITDRVLSEAANHAHLERESALADLGRLAVVGDRLPVLMREAGRLLQRAFRADFCGVAELSASGDRLVVRSVASAPDAPKKPYRPDRSGIALAQSLGGIAIQLDRPAVMNDVSHEARFDVSVLRGLGVISALVAPIRLQERCYGTVGVHSLSPRVFSDEEVRCIEVFGHILAAAIDRSQALEQLRASESQLRSLFENLPDVVCVVDRHGRIQSSNQAAAGSASAWTVETRFVDNLPAEHHAELAKAFESVCAQHESLTLEVRSIQGSWWAIRLSPLASGKKSLALVIATDITVRHEALLAQERNEMLLRQSLLAHEKDRSLVAYEIHDGLVQDVTGSVMHLDAISREGLPQKAAAQLDLAMRTMRRTIDEGRRLISGLRPPIIDELGIVAAIDYLINERRAGQTCEIEFEHQVVHERFDSLLEGTIYRIVQEGLSNIHRHSRSPRARVRLIENPRMMRLEIRDWGTGFNPQQAVQRSFGLKGVRERARLLGGTATIDSRPGEGTDICVELPLPSAPSS